MNRHVVWPAGLLLVLTGCSEKAPAGPCDGITCSGHGDCVVTAGAAACVCEAGFDPDGLACVDPANPTTDQIVQHGVVFTFDAQVPFGQYANGDYWVQGPVTVTRIQPDAAGGHHGWEVSPADVTRQGFDVRAASYDATLTPALPYVAQPGDALVKSISLEPLDDADCRPCLRTAVVLTVVDAPPPDAGATVFRPPYFGADRALYSTTALRTDLLPELTAPASAPGFPAVTEAFRRVQLDHQNGWSGAAIHPAENLPEYGSDVAVHTAEGALQLLVGPAGAEKDLAAIMVVQAGIDLYHMAVNGQTWPANGGHAEGRKLPIALAALLLEDVAMADLVRTADRDTFGENRGMYRSPGGVVLYGQIDAAEEGYWRNLVFDTGSRTLSDPYGFIDGGHAPGGSYQFCCLAMPWKATAAAVRLLPGLEAIWNHPEFLEYVDRWVERGAHAQPDTCAPPTGVCAGGDQPGAACTTASAPTACTGEDAVCDTTGSWDAGYGVTYGPDGSGGCIADTDPSDGTGRFPLLHGASQDDGYHGSAFGNEMWSAFVSP